MERIEQQPIIQTVNSVRRDHFEAGAESKVIASPGEPGSASSQPTAESRRAFKYPYVACEVFCCEVDPIFTTLQENEDLMAKLFSILDQPCPLDCVLAGTLSSGSHISEQCLDVVADPRGGLQYGGFGSETGQVGDPFLVG